MMKMRLSWLALMTACAGFLAIATPATAQPELSYSWKLSPTGTDARLRGLDAVNRTVVWVSGSQGTVLRTVDGGSQWIDVSVPGAAGQGLQFRDIQAFNSRTAVVLSIGNGADSRIYRTDDGGSSWVLTFTNDDPSAFFDCISFWDHRHGLALSDPVNGRFRILSTDDGGRSWSLVDPAGMPPALDGEFAFAASGTCLVTAGGRDAWIASGGVNPARVFHSRDRGRTWTVESTPMAGGATAGIFSLAFRGPSQGLAVGGDFGLPDLAVDSAARSTDRGRTWSLASDLPNGYRSGVAWLRTPRTAIAVGPSGSDFTTDSGRTWTTFDAGSFDSVDCTNDGACWASGELGRVGKLGKS